MIEINPDRLLTLLRALAAFGADEHGITRLAFSKADTRAREWVSARLEEAGLAAAIDAIGNVYGRDPGAERAVLLGSHTDSVPRGGWLDGALGVVYALEIALALCDQSGKRAIGIDVIDFQDEEGTFSPCLGSRLFCGEVSEQNALAIVPSHSAIGRMPASASFHRYEQRRHVAYLEAHIEQGPKLEAASCTIGIVQGIVGIRRFRLQATGRADHAGTTPITMRRDAARALFELAHHVHHEFPHLAARDSVWNTGNFSLEPGAANVVPGRAKMLVEIRDLDEAVLDVLENSLRACAQAQGESTLVEIRIERTACIAPQPMSQRLIDLFDRVAQGLAQKRQMMPSGAGHDAMIVARVMPAGMMFIPSIGGRSHSKAENTREEDIVAGCRVFAAAVDELISDPRWRA